MRWFRRKPKRIPVRHTPSVVFARPQTDARLLKLSNGCGLIPHKDGTADYICDACGVVTRIGYPGGSAADVLPFLAEFKCPNCGAV